MNTIVFKGDFIRKEGVADEAITPGHLVERGGTYDFQKHSTAGGPAAPSFALENDLVGDGIDTAYASDDTVQVAYCPCGAEVYAYLTTSQVIVKGDYLVSNGAGLLQKFDPSVDTSSTSVDVYRNSVVARALEAVTTTSAVSRIKVEVV